MNNNKQNKSEEKIITALIAAIQCYLKAYDDKFQVKSIKRTTSSLSNWANDGRFLTIENRQTTPYIINLFPHFYSLVEPLLHP